MPAKTQKQLLEANMKELLEKLAELDRIDESTDPTPAEVKRIDEGASMNISMSGDSASEVASLLKIMQGGGAPDAKPVDMDMINPPMSKLKAIVGPKPPMDMKKDLMGDEESKEEWDNSPDEDYKDQHYMTKDLSGGINREKNQYKAANRGDNAMAMEDELRSELAKALAEKMAPADADFDESGCVGEMKKLYASGCAKHEMFKKVQDEYGCDKGKFEKLFAAHCG